MLVNFIKNALKISPYLAHPLLRKIPKEKIIGIEIQQEGIGRKELIEMLLPKKSVGVEIGVWKGAFARELLSRIQPSYMHLVDPWLFSPENYWARWGGGGKGRWAVVESQDEMDKVFADVQTAMSGENVKIWRMTSEEFFKSFTEKVDWVYTDGNHSYEFVLQDLNGANSIIKEGGIIWGDDLYWDEIIRAGADEISLPVKKAVVEFCKANKKKYVAICNQYIIL